ncbi:hypothetical protein Avbf_10410 [Armadillidium vulgare]|nr:hypothetical protein Avbf_10410 [Armadillidium vulgare]
MYFINKDVKPSVGVNSSKKQKISVANITHESMERIKSNMDRHTYTVRIRDWRRGLEESFKIVVTEVVNEILRDLDYDSATMREGACRRVPLKQLYCIEKRYVKASLKTM